MILPKNLLTNTYTRPDVYLCEVDKEKICKLEPINLNGSFKFNAYSEITFDIARVYNDVLTGETRINPYFDKIEALRLIYINGFGYFELQGPELTSNGIEERKSCTAYSLEYTLSQKYLDDFYINTGEVNSLEVLNAESESIIPITLYNPEHKKLSLLHLMLEKVYGWSIGHVDDSLKTLSRQFEIDRKSVYDFIMNDICEKFNCYAVFDTVNNIINLYAESLTSKFIGDGTTNTFTVSPPFSKVGTVSIDGYKTTRWDYDQTTGVLVLEDIPYAGAHIEVVDGALTEWETDVFVSFDNLAQEAKIDYNADDLKTVLTVTYGDDGDIREANLGLPYLTDLSYYYTVDWMGQDLYDAYTAYLQKTNQYQSQYANNSQEMLNIAGYIDFEENRLSLDYSIALSVNEATVGTYYVRGGTAPNYYYTEVSLPSEYNVNTTYYSVNTANLNEDKVSNLYTVLKKYFNQEDDWQTELDKLSDEFQFMETYTISYLSSELAQADPEGNGADTAINNFLDEMWEEIGRTPLQSLYYEPYKKRQIANIEAGWSQKSNANYGYYYPVVLMLNSINAAITKRSIAIADYENQYNALQQMNATISDDLLIANNFTAGQAARLSAFLREDELQLDDIVETSQDTIVDSFKIKQDAMESGKIELSKLSQPQLQFSMSMANIYALPEFEPIVNQFQLGNVIKIGLRKDYIKQSRLLQVDINFDDFSDFKVEFGELTSLRTQSDIHADLLSKTISAGKTVANQASYWTKGSDKANSTDLKIQQGLLDANTQLKAIDATQDIVVDKYGLHMRKVDPITHEIDPRQGWIVNNGIHYSSDGFKSTKSVFGEYTVDNTTYWGLLAECVIAGYIEGSTIKGGTIHIGERPDGKYNFEVNQNGEVTFYGGKSISSNGEEIDLDTYNMTVEVTADRTVFGNNTQNITLICKVYSYGADVTDNYDSSAFRWIRSTGDDESDQKWNEEHYTASSNNVLTITINDVSDIAFFSCQVSLPTVKSSNSVAISLNSSDIHIFTSQPNIILLDGRCYHKGDLWVVGSDYQPTGYSQNTILVSTADASEYADGHWVESVYYSTTFAEINSWKSDMQEYVQILDDGLHLIGPASDGVSFESLLQSRKLTFRLNNGGVANDIVWLGVDDMTAKNVTVLNYLNVKSDSSALPYIKLGDFTLQIEENGSLSIT